MCVLVTALHSFPSTGQQTIQSGHLLRTGIVQYTLCFLTQSCEAGTTITFLQTGQIRKPNKKGLSNITADVEPSSRERDLRPKMVPTQPLGTLHHVHLIFVSPSLLSPTFPPVSQDCQESS